MDRLPVLRLVLQPSGPRAARPDLTGPAGLAALSDLAAVADLADLTALTGLTAQLDRLTPGAGRVIVVGGQSPAERLDHLRSAVSAADDVLLVAAEVVLPDAAFRLVLGASRPSVLIRRGAGRHPVATTGGVVVSAATALHPLDGADADAMGVLFLPAASAFAASAALQAAAAAARVGAWPDVDLADLVLTALVRGGLPVAAAAVEPFPGGRFRDAAEAAALTAEVAGIDEAALASRRSSRPDDGFYSTFVLRKLSRPISRWGAAHGVSANAVTILSGVLGVLAAVLFGTGEYVGLLIGALLLQVSLVLDCVDGEIARATGTFSAFGAWLDASLDRVKEYGALAGLAVGAARDGHDLWLLALAGMVLQTARHVQDFAFDKGVLAAWRAPLIDRRPLTDLTPWPGPAQPTRPPHSAGSAGSARSAGSAGSAVLSGAAPTASTWLRRVIHMPIAERWLVLSLGAALGHPLWSLVAYLALTAVAAGWTLLGALRRSLRTSAPYPGALQTSLARYRDDGLLNLVGRDRGPAGTAGWLLPVAVTALEGVVLLAIATSGGLTIRAWAFAWFTALAWHRYDLIYRWRDRSLAVPVWVGRAGGGWLVRCVVLVVAALAGVLVPVLIIGTLWLALVYVPESLAASARSWRPARGPVPALSPGPNIRTTKATEPNPSRTPLEKDV